MIESTVLNVMLADDTLCDLLATYNGLPAIFSDEAPENADKPYIVFRVSKSENENKAMQDMTVNIDYFNYNGSRPNSRTAAERIEFLFDDQRLQHERYLDIHFSVFGGDEIGGEDPRDIHYNTQIQAQAVRMKWINETKT